MNKTFLALGIITILLYSCKDADVLNPNDLTSTQSCQDHLIAESIFNDAGHIVKEALQNAGEAKSYPKYNLINLNPSDIDTLIIDFGNTNHLHNGKLRKGIINVTFTGKYSEYLSVITTTFDNYYVNNNLVQGEVILTNQGETDTITGKIRFTINIQNASVMTPNGLINWQSSITQEWVSGQDTYSEISDDKYIITGSGSGNNVNGMPFQFTIMDTLNLDFSCLPPYCKIKSGKTKISPNNYTDRIINYGDSLCDCNVNVLIEENTHLIVVNY